MNTDEYIIFLKSTLIKIENAINLLNIGCPKHILAYHKMLGVQQKISKLEENHRNQLFEEIIIIRSVIHYLINGKYGRAFSQIIKLKKNIIKICSVLENERNKNK